jgi:putative transcriptional regulator
MTQILPQEGQNAADPATMLPAELLLDYASGATPEPVALAVATYLDMNPSAAHVYHKLNDIGGSLIDTIEPALISDTGLSAILARIDNVPVDAKTFSISSVENCSVPRPLQPYIGRSWDSLAWKTVTAGVQEYVISTSTRGWRTSLLRIAPGKAMPTHTHAGEEYTVVLDGAYIDEAGRFARGSIEVADSEVTHKPIADTTYGCVCLAVLSAPVQLTGMLGWLVNPFLRH